jgi:muconolactone delta-isomerase
MKILALEMEVPDIPDEAFEPHLRNEAARAWELQQAGVLRELYFRDDRHEAVLVLECETLRAAEEALATLPLVQKGLIRFELIPLRPYPGFARLFGTAA